MAHNTTRLQPSPILTLILLTTLVRLAFGWALGLGVDESYMVAAGRVLQLGYFDHPPASWWLSWTATHLFGSEAPIVVRLPFIALFALSTWLMYRLGAAVAGERAGLWAAVLLNLSPVFAVTTGTWVLPDGPLDCALLGAALCLIHALPERGRAAWLWWMAAGACAGLALFSKYSAVLTIVGAFGFLVTSRRHRVWLARPHPYVAGLIAFAVFAPVLVWNASHGWASFAFQGERAGGLKFRPFAPLTTLAGEALFVLPWIWLPMMAVFIAALRLGPRSWRSWLLCCLAAPSIVAFALISAWSSQRVLFHWAAPGYLMLFPLLGYAVVQRWNAAIRRTVIATAALICAVLLVIGSEIRLGWLDPTIAALAVRRDPVLDGIDWTSLRDDLAARGLLKPGAVVGVPNWRDGGKIAYALGQTTITLCLNADARQFAFAHPLGDFVGDDVLLLVLDHPAEVARRLGPLFDALTPLPPSAVMHRGQEIQTVAVFRGQHFHGGPAP